jgi:tetratricopeptide (TPR) repeat protein
VYSLDLLAAGYAGQLKYRQAAETLARAIGVIEAIQWTPPKNLQISIFERYATALDNLDRHSEAAGWHAKVAALGESESPAGSRTERDSGFEPPASEPPSGSWPSRTPECDPAACLAKVDARLRQLYDHLENDEITDDFEEERDTRRKQFELWRRVVDDCERRVRPMKASMTSAESACRLPREQRALVVNAKKSFERGTLLQNEADFHKAISAFEEALPAFRDLLGADDFWYAETLGKMADIWERNGRYAEAKSALVKALPAYRAGLEEVHPWYVERLQQLAACNIALAAYDEAERELQQSLELARKGEGEDPWLADDTPLAAERQRNLARLYVARDRFPAAETAVGPALTVFDRMLPKGYENYTECLWLLAVARSRQGKDAVAAAASSRAIELIETFGCPPRHVPYADLLDQHAASLRRLKRTDEAARFESQSRVLRAAESQAKTRVQ